MGINVKEHNQPNNKNNSNNNNNSKYKYKIRVCIDYPITTSKTQSNKTMNWTHKAATTTNKGIDCETNCVTNIYYIETTIREQE